MNELHLPDYNLYNTLLGGQAFNWECKKYGSNEFTFYGTTQTRLIKIQPISNDKILWQTYPILNDYKFIEKYLRINVDYKKILNVINKDNHLNLAIANSPSLRLLSQDFDQTVLSFIVSAFNSIGSIRTRLNRMKSTLGTQYELDGDSFYLFPETSVIAESEISELEAFGLGYRAKYLKETARRLLKLRLSEDFAGNNGFDEEYVRGRLIELPGIGEKVADCIMVFALNFDNITPLDVWGKRIFTELYGLPSGSSIKEIRKWINDYFHGYGAWAGQFLFEWYRSKGPRTKKR